LEGWAISTERSSKGRSFHADGPTGHSMLMDPQGLEETIKRARNITWKRAQLERKAIPDRGTSRRERPILFNDRGRTWYQIVTTRGQQRRPPPSL